MLTKIEIENFKSIYKETIELGRVNVFIGENGCGKTNILEAVGMASAAYIKKISNDELSQKGLRVTKPSITFSSFKNIKTDDEINITIYYHSQRFDFEIPLKFSLTSPKRDDIFSSWKTTFDWGDMSADEKIYIQNLLDSEEELPSDLKIKNDKWEKIVLSIGTYGFPLRAFLIYQLSTELLRGIGGISHTIPGIHGENLDVLLANFSKEEFQELLDHSHFISWLEDIVIDREGGLRLQGHNLNLSQSKLYFKDKFMQKKNNIFSAENANEGILHILFYLALFISKKTPKFFAIDNIETALNPHLCTKLMEELVTIAKKNDKQVLITTHNPAILDGLDLHDDEVRLFVVSRDFKGHTRVERLKLKPDVKPNGRQLKLSEHWMRGNLGGIPQHF